MESAVRSLSALSLKDIDNPTIINTAANKSKSTEKDVLSLSAIANSVAYPQDDSKAIATPDAVSTMTLHSGLLFMSNVRGMSTMNST